MKKKLLLVVSALALSTTAAFAADTTPATTIVNGGTVHFKGEVVNAACAVDSSSSDQTVPLGQIRAAKLQKLGDHGNNVGFTIKLNDCDTGVSTKASVAFSGAAIDSTNTSVLALQGSSAGGAQNVGIQILDNQGKPLELNSTTFSTPVNLISGSTTIPLQARFYATGAATAGTANADATFKVQYQ